MWEKVKCLAFGMISRNSSVAFNSTFDLTCTVNDLWNDIQDAIITAIAKHVYKVSTSMFRQPWITTGVTKLSRRRKRAYQKSKSSNDDADYIDFVISTNIRRWRVELPATTM